MPATSSICVIMPTYNRAHMICEAIDSILAQTRPVQEIIIVNDGSTDDTESVVKSYGGRVTLITKKNGGRASAINAGLRKCKSDYVWTFDDDDIAVPDGIEHLATALDADDTIGFVYGAHRFFRDEPKGRSYFDPIQCNYDEEPNINIRFLEGMFAHMSAMLIRFSLYTEMGFFREEFLRSQDYDMMIRLSRKAKSAPIPKKIFLYRVHEGVRGPAEDSFSAQDSARKWQMYEGRILSSLRNEFRLEEFTPTFALKWDIEHATRTALLERAGIFARRFLWSEAIDDLLRGAKISSAVATPQEIHLAERLFCFVSTWEALENNQELLEKISTYYKASNYGRCVIFAACRPLVGHIRYLFTHGRFLYGMRMLRIMVGILGIRGTCSRALTSLLQ